jgi:hypothetical protein
VTEAADEAAAPRSGVVSASAMSAVKQALIPRQRFNARASVVRPCASVIPSCKRRPDMKIGVLGTGMVGATIGTKLVALGHEVKMGVESVHD